MTEKPRKVGKSLLQSTLTTSKQFHGQSKELSVKRQLFKEGKENIAKTTNTILSKSSKP
jgi:hypothetical protein